MRERGGGFPGVRALGLDLPRAGLVQVSMNVEDWEAAALHEIVARIAAEAEARGARGRRLRARRPDARRRRRGGGRSGAQDRRVRRVACARAAPARPMSPTSGTAIAAPPKTAGADATSEERRDEHQPGRVRAAVGERDHAEHAAEQMVGHLLLRRRVEQHDRRALAGRREERAGDGQRQRAGERDQSVRRAGTSPRRAGSRAPCGGSAGARAAMPLTIDPAA